MSKVMKNMTVSAGGAGAHIETPLGIINIQAGLTDNQGRRVDSIEVLPDTGKCTDGPRHLRIVEPKNGERPSELQSKLDADTDRALKALEIVRKLAAEYTDYTHDRQQFIVLAARLLDEHNFLDEASQLAQDTNKDKVPS